MKSLVKIADSVGTFEDLWGLGWEAVQVRRSGHPQGQCQEAKDALKKAQKDLWETADRIKNEQAAVAEEDDVDDVEKKKNAAAVAARAASLAAFVASIEEKNAEAESIRLAMKEKEAAAKIAGWSGTGFETLPEGGAFGDEEILGAFFSRWTDEHVLPFWYNADGEEWTPENDALVAAAEAEAVIVCEESQAIAKAAHEDAYKKADDAFLDEQVEAGLLESEMLALDAEEREGRKGKALELQRARLLRAAKLQKTKAEGDADDAGRAAMIKADEERREAIAAKLASSGILPVPHGGQTVRRAVADWILACAEEQEAKYKEAMGFLSRSSA